MGYSRGGFRFPNFRSGDMVDGKSRVSTPASHTGAAFATTRWAVIREAVSANSPVGTDALASLCQTYWPPVYGYLRRSGVTPADAKDLTQGFFAQVLARGFFSLADEDKGRFRTFLLCALQNFQRDQHLRAQALKRGGGQVVSLDALAAEGEFLADAADHLTPERAFERRWALTLLMTVMSRLEAEFCVGARAELFAELRGRLWGEQRGEPASAIAARLQLSESAIHVMLHRLRHRLRELIRNEIAEQVASARDLEDELAHLIRVLGSPG